MSARNNRLASNANAALVAYCRIDHRVAEDHNALIALLCDIRHLCDAHGWKIAKLDRDAAQLYQSDLSREPKASEVAS